MSVRANCINDPRGNLLDTFLPGVTLQFIYDAANRLTNMVDAVGATSYAYGSAGTFLTEDGPWANDTMAISFTNTVRASL
jgi:YD repeat-containing protein